MAAGDEAGLVATGLAVEPGVQDRRVRLAGPGANVACVEQRDAELESRQLPRDGSAHVSGADDRDVDSAGQCDVTGPRPGRSDGLSSVAHLLGIDEGTSAVKAALYDEELNPVAEARRDKTSAIPTRGG